MQIFGSIIEKDKKFIFHFKKNQEDFVVPDSIHTFSENKIFVYIDGVVTKLSDDANKISRRFKTINKKIAYLYYSGFDLESHIIGSFNIYLFNYALSQLKIIRDTRGTRSIFYAQKEKDFIFSSSQDLLIERLPSVSLNENKLIDFLNWDYRSNDETYFNEISRIRPKNYLILEKMNIVTKKYKTSMELFNRYKNKDSKENFKKLLYQSVESVSNRNQKIGLMMSGGLDSSAIAIALKENNFINVKTYSANFRHIPNRNIDETLYQENVSKLTSFKHESVPMKGKSSIKPIHRFTKIFSQPIMFPNIYLFEEIIKKAKEDNIEIILDGNDGDNTVSHGFEVLYYFFTKLMFFKFIKEIYLYSKFINASFIRLLYLFINQAIKKIFKIKQNENKKSILKSDLKIKKNRKNIISFFSSHKRKLSIDLHYLGNEYRNDLFRYFEIENFSPFYDEDLINFCLNMHYKDKLHNGYTRNILRRFLADFLPKDHVNRDKSTLTPGLLSNFTNTDLNFIKNNFKKINETLSELVDLEKLKNIICDLEDGVELDEERLIDLQIFISANTFLNQYNF